MKNEEFNFCYIAALPIYLVPRSHWLANLVSRVNKQSFSEKYRRRFDPIYMARPWQYKDYFPY